MQTISCTQILRGQKPVKKGSLAFTSIHHSRRLKTTALREISGLMLSASIITQYKLQMWFLTIFIPSLTHHCRQECQIFLLHLLDLLYSGLSSLMEAVLFSTCGTNVPLVATIQAEYNINAECSIISHSVEVTGFFPLTCGSPFPSLVSDMDCYNKIQIEFLLPAYRLDKSPESFLCWKKMRKWRRYKSEHWGICFFSRVCVTLTSPNMRFQCTFHSHALVFLCRDFQFGHMDGNDYINSLIMG